MNSKYKCFSINEIFFKGMSVSEAESKFKSKSESESESESEYKEDYKRKYSSDRLYYAEWHDGPMYDEKDESIDRYAVFYKTEDDSIIDKIQLNDYHEFDPCIDFFKLENDIYITCNRYHGVLSLYKLNTDSISHVHDSDENDMFHDEIIYRDDIYLVVSEWV